MQYRARSTCSLSRMSFSCGPSTCRFGVLLLFLRIVIAGTFARRFLSELCRIRIQALAAKFFFVDGRQGGAPELMCGSVRESLIRDTFGDRVKATQRPAEALDCQRCSRNALSVARLQDQEFALRLFYIFSTSRV